MQLTKWLYPGMRVKRWLALALAGLLLFVVGVDLLFKGEIIGNVALALHQLEERFLSDAARWTAGILVLLAGLSVMAAGLLKAIHSVAAALKPGHEGRVAEIIYARENLRRGPKIVVIGGGTGLSVLLRGLKEYTSNLTAIVTVADDGGSSGRLRGDLGILPPGDIRNCLVALAEKEPLMEELLQYRFRAGELAGHSIGNLLLAALCDLTGGFDNAVRGLSKVLAVSGQVLPATLADVTLCAEMSDGKVVRGESSITRSGGQIKRVFLSPSRCFPPAEALSAIREADAVILGPGSLYTSVIPNLLVKGVAESLARTPALKIYVCNVMTQPGETAGYSASDHVRAITGHAGQLIDYVIVNTGEVPSRLKTRYRQEGADPVAADIREIESLGVTAVGENLVHRTIVVRHHSDRLAQVILGTIVTARGQAERIRFLNGQKNGAGAESASQDARRGF
jgi:uncharacterized cofD-like protein